MFRKELCLEKEKIPVYTLHSLYQFLTNIAIITIYGDTFILYQYHSNDAYMTQ